MGQYKYCQCASLGWYCGTASSLSKLGLRNASGPFDWFCSDYWAVLKIIENEFSDFMNVDNLVEKDGDKKVFIDKKYGFYFNHDVKNDYSEERDDILKKYNRRAKRFIGSICRPTLFFRCVRSEDEIKYINENWEYAEGVIKKYNENNGIVYVIRSDMSTLTEKVLSFRLPIDNWLGKVPEMRYLFWQSDKLKLFCEDLLEKDVINNNLIIDQRNNSRKEKICLIRRYVEGEQEEISEYFNEIHNKYGRERDFYVWGAGKYGMIITKYLIGHNYSIAGVVDNYKEGKILERIPIIRANDISKGAVVFISITNALVSSAVKEQIENLKRNVHVETFDDMIQAQNWVCKKELLEWYREK